jgi:hypothetical protein
VALFEPLKGGLKLDRQCLFSAGLRHQYSYIVMRDTKDNVRF